MTSSFIKDRVSKKLNTSSQGRSAADLAQVVGEAVEDVEKVLNELLMEGKAQALGSRYPGGQELWVWKAR